MPSETLLRATRLKSQASCARGSILVYDPTSTTLRIIPATCKSWDCPYCAPRKRDAWAARLAAGEPYLALTLTTQYKPWKCATREAPRLKKAWTKLVQRIRRKFGWFEYALVWELQKNGMPHAHVLARGPYIPKPWLKKNWMELTGAYMVDIHRIRDPKAAAAHHCKSLADSIVAPGYSPERLASKQTSQTAQALAPMRIIQLSKGYEHPPNAPEPPPEEEKKICLFSLDNPAAWSEELSQALLGVLYYDSSSGSYELSSGLPPALLRTTTFRLNGAMTSFEEIIAKRHFFDSYVPPEPAPPQAVQQLIDWCPAEDFDLENDF